MELEDSNNIFYGRDSTISITIDDVKIINARLIELNGLKEKVIVYEQLTRNMQESINDLKEDCNTLNTELKQTNEKYLVENKRKKIWRNSSIGLAGVLLLIIIL